MYKSMAIQTYKRCLLSVCESWDNRILRTQIETFEINIL